jgi:hypothetical protein
VADQEESDVLVESHSIGVRVGANQVKLKLNLSTVCLPQKKIVYSMHYSTYATCRLRGLIIATVDAISECDGVSQTGSSRCVKEFGRTNSDWRKMIWGSTIERSVTF